MLHSVLKEYLQSFRESHRSLLCSFLGGVIIGYVHNLSEIKTSQRNNLYFDMSLQTQDKLYRAVSIQQCIKPPVNRVEEEKYFY